MEIMKTLLYTIGLILSTSTLTLAQEAPRCRDYDPVVFEEFYADFGESPVFEGLTAQGDIFTVIVNPVTGTFSLLATDGLMICLIGSGSKAKTPRALPPNSKAS